MFVASPRNHITLHPILEMWRLMKGEAVHFPPLEKPRLVIRRELAIRIHAAKNSAPEESDKSIGSIKHNGPCRMLPCVSLPGQGGPTTNARHHPQCVCSSVAARRARRIESITQAKRPLLRRCGAACPARADLLQTINLTHHAFVVAALPEGQGASSRSRRQNGPCSADAERRTYYKRSTAPTMRL